MTSGLIWQQKLALHLIIAVAAAGVHAVLYATGAGVYSFDKATWHDFFHLSVMSSTTIGFGDVYPLSLAARAATWVHALAVILLLAS